MFVSAAVLTPRGGWECSQPQFFASVREPTGALVFRWGTVALLFSPPVLSPIYCFFSGEPSSAFSCAPNKCHVAIFPGSLLLPERTATRVCCDFLDFLGVFVFSASQASCYPRAVVAVPCYMLATPFLSTRYERQQSSPFHIFSSQTCQNALLSEKLFTPLSRAPMTGNNHPALSRRSSASRRFATETSARRSWYRRLRITSWSLFDSLYYLADLRGFTGLSSSAVAWFH